MADDIFKVLTDDLTKTSHAIKKDTDMLRGQSSQQISHIDETGLTLPSVMYNQLLPLLSNIEAYLNRSMEIRDRITTVLDEVVKVVEEQEQQLVKGFTPQNNNNK